MRIVLQRQVLAEFVEKLNYLIKVHHRQVFEVAGEGREPAVNERNHVRGLEPDISPTGFVPDQIVGMNIATQYKRDSERPLGLRSFRGRLHGSCAGHRVLHLARWLCR